MLKYTTMVYEGEEFDERYGWEFGNIILFQSDDYDDPSSAMMEFRKFRLPGKPWFSYMRVVENGEIIEEELFDTNTVKID